MLEDPDRAERLLRGYNQMLGKNGGRVFKMRPLSSYTPKKIDWLWDQRIPLGKVSILAGDGGEGKSFATLGISAAVTTGSALPEGASTEPRNVVIWNGEDGAEDTIHGRATGAGANLDRIQVINIEERGKTVPFSLRDMPMLTDLLEDSRDAALVVIDPITALLANVDSARDAEVRSALQPLSDLAQRTGAAVLLVMHLKKGEETNILHRLSGSVAFGALARSAMFLGTHAYSGRKSIDTVKHNLAQGKPAPIEFALTPEGFRWVGLAPELTAEAIRLSRFTMNHDKRGEGAEAFLKEMLATGPIDSKAIWRGARERGIAEATLKRAKERLDIKPKKHGFGDGAVWIWSLPDSEESPERVNDPLRSSSVIQLEEYQRTSLGRGVPNGPSEPKKIIDPVRDRDWQDMLDFYDGKGVNET